jgi:protein phosphatase
VVVVLVHEVGAFVAHVGDSRVYHVHAGAISQVTRDHSMVQELVDRNLIKAEDAATHPEANKILRALGIAREVEVDVRAEPISYVSGDTFLLCSDGLSDLATAADILDVIAKNPPPQAAGSLVDLANARGGHDNITALVVRTKTTATTGPSPTLLKTLPLTAAPAQAVHGSQSAASPTIMQAPLGDPRSAPQAQGPLPVPTQAMPQARPMPSQDGPHHGDSPTHPGAHGSERRIAVLLGLLAALLALGALGVVAMNRTRHRSVPVVEEPRGDGGSAAAPEPEPDGDDPGAVPSVAPLAPPTAEHHRHGEGHGDGGRPRDPCAAAARARESGKSDTIVRALEAQCAAATASPNPSPTPPAPTLAPLPTATPTTP